MPTAKKDPKRERRHPLATVGMYAGGLTVPALLAWLIARRPRLAGFNLRQRNIAKLMHQGRYGVVLDDEGYNAAMAMSPFKRRLQFGTPHVLTPGKPVPEGVKAVFAPDLMRDASLRRWIARNKLVPVNPSTRALRPLVPDAKVPEAKFFKKHVPQTIPTSTWLRRGQLKGTEVQRARQLREILSTRLGKKWVLKHNEDFQTAGTLITERTDLQELIRRYGKLKPKSNVPKANVRLGYLRRLAKTDPQAFTEYGHAAGKKFIQYERLRKILRAPHTGLGQVREPLARPEVNPLWNWFRNQLAKTRLISPAKPEYYSSPKEWRVHVVGGRMIPAVTARHEYTGLPDILQAISANLTPESRELKRFTEKMIRRLPAGARGGPYGFDIAKTQGGKFKVMEANPLGYSGLMFSSHPDEGFNPLAARLHHSLVGTLQGRPTAAMTAPIAAAAGLAGVGGVGAYDIGRAIARRRRKKAKPTGKEKAMA